MKNKDSYHNISWSLISSTILNKGGNCGLHHCQSTDEAPGQLKAPVLLTILAVFG